MAKFRDLELGNESRKILARMLNRVLDEVCACPETGLSSTQQAFVKGRDIVRNTSAMLRTFWDNVESQSAKEDPLLMLLLDCSKGYNLMSRGWVLRVLAKARNSGMPVVMLSVHNCGRPSSQSIAESRRSPNCVRICG